MQHFGQVVRLAPGIVAVAPQPVHILLRIALHVGQPIDEHPDDDDNGDNDPRHHEQLHEKPSARRLDGRQIIGRGWGHRKQGQGAKDEGQQQNLLPSLNVDRPDEASTRVDTPTDLPLLGGWRRPTDGRRIGQAVPPDMQLLELTLDTPAENVALDEALLLTAEARDATDEVLRIWEPRQYFVVLGSSSRIASEVNREYCNAKGIEVVRRTSGGAAIVAGPGCLMYSLVLSLSERPELRSIDRAHRFVLDALGTTFGRLVSDIARRGTSDLAIGDRKFSGNSLRLKRRNLLYHGTLLYDFPLDLVAPACQVRRVSRPIGPAAHTESLSSTCPSIFGRSMPQSQQRLVRQFSGSAGPAN